MALNFPEEHLAVFNNHVADAGKRAMEVCRARFADSLEDPDMVALEDANRDGIMAIFNDELTPHTRLYRAACFIFANRLDKTFGQNADEKIQTTSQATRNKSALALTSGLSLVLVEMVGADKASTILKDAARLVPYPD